MLHELGLTFRMQQMTLQGPKGRRRLCVRNVAKITRLQVPYCDNLFHKLLLKIFMCFVVGIRGTAGWNYYTTRLFFTSSINCTFIGARDLKQIMSLSYTHIAFLCLRTSCLSLTVRFESSFRSPNFDSYIFSGLFSELRTRSNWNETISG